MAPPAKPVKKSGGGVKALLSRGLGPVFDSFAWAQKHFWTFALKGGRVGWMVLTASVVMLMPILFEVQREQQVIEVEKLLIEDYRKQGFTDQDLARMGLTSAVEPAVGLKDAADAATASGTP